jgi:hypothetical protein
MNHRDFAAGLRQIAAWIEQHPEVDLPEPALTACSLYSKENAAVTARALGAGGRCDKIFSDTLVTLKRDFGGVAVQYHGTRSSVCQQVAVGKRVVPEQYVPPRPATEAQVIPEHEETVYEWICSPMLAAGEGVEMPVEAAALTARAVPMLEAGAKLEDEYDSIPF